MKTLEEDKPQSMMVQTKQVYPRNHNKVKQIGNLVDLDVGSDRIVAVDSQGLIFEQMFNNTSKNVKKFNIKGCTLNKSIVLVFL